MILPTVSRSFGWFITITQSPSDRDGQQRFTTFIIFLQAFVDFIKELSEAIRRLPKGGFLGRQPSEHSLHHLCVMPDITCPFFIVKNCETDKREVIMRRHSVSVLAFLAVFVWSLVDTMGGGSAYADVNDPRPGQWSGGGAIGFLGNTPDGATEFALKGHADYFMSRNFSVGPLAQYAGAGNDFLFGLSAQAKYFWDIPRNRNMKLVVQGGIGFIRAGIKSSELGGAADTYTSFLIPIGVGVDYTVSKNLAATVDFLLNFTSLGDTVRAGGREFDFHTNVMPGLYFGLRF